MIADTRDLFNKNFSDEKYQEFLNSLTEEFKSKINFRISETPVFIPGDLKEKLIDASCDIIKVIKSPDFKNKTTRAIPKHQYVPNEDEHTQFLAIDFAICKNEKGEFDPQLIELQGFPSLYCYQASLGNQYKEIYGIPSDYNYLFNNDDNESYALLMKRFLLGRHKPENVILLEIEPDLQKTNVDFYATRNMTGIEPVCISKVIREGRKLFYLKDGNKTRIHRIYNRVIFDELETRDDLKREFNLTEEVDVEWVGHPNWYFRISKFILPLLKSKYVPETYYVNELPSIPDDLENYVLKPLFSFAGTGVIFNVQREDITDLKHPENYILQKKVHYTPAIKSPDGDVKAEIRMLYIWEKDAPEPILVTNIARMSKGVMIGVRFNENKTWVGGSIGMFRG